MKWLESQAQPTILLLQESLTSWKGCSYIPKGYVGFWSNLNTKTLEVEYKHKSIANEFAAPTTTTTCMNEIDCGLLAGENLGGEHNTEEELRVSKEILNMHDGSSKDGECSKKRDRERLSYTRGYEGRELDCKQTRNMRNKRVKVSRGEYTSNMDTLEIEPKVMDVQINELTTRLLQQTRYDSDVVHGVKKRKWEGKKNERGGSKFNKSEKEVDIRLYNGEREGRKRVRSMIIAPKSLNGYMVTQISSIDYVVVRFESLNISLVSMYCDINRSIDDVFSNVLREQSMGHRMIICADTNAHSIAWGALGDRKNRFKSYSRGDEICNMLEEMDLCICNVLPHSPTFYGGIGHPTHIDTTFCTSTLLDRISEWRVDPNHFESDHRSISFVLSYIRKRGCMHIDDNKDIAWIRPNERKVRLMKCALPKMVKFRRRIKYERDVTVFVQQHTCEVKEALEKFFKNKNVQGKACSGYKHESMVEEYNKARKRFREEVRKVKLEAWKEFTTNIDNPWKGLVKMLKSQDKNRSQDRTLCDINGKYAYDVKSTLSMLSDQFYLKRMEYSAEHMQIEKSVEASLVNIEVGQDIMVCEFRKVMSEMKKAKAPGNDKITNCVLHILADECKFEKQYINLFNVCLKQSVFPNEWKKATIVLIPKETELLDSVKAFRPISLTSVFSKVIERIVLARILYYLELSGNLALSQHAYRKGSSTTTALYEVTKFTQDALHEKEVCIMVFPDISGAFDRTWHGGILYRLLQYSVPKYLVKWVRSFLEDRSAHFESVGVKHVTNISMSLIHVDTGSSRF